MNNTPATNNKSTSNTANSSNKLTNDEYSRLAAKAAGVAIGSNGKPAFTSYEQSMKYAEALTNLHKSGINRNSTPQEIAAASVGTTVNKNGTPNISSVSQGQSYGNALKNIKSSPQPNVNQNSNGAKTNNTSSGSNTNNNTNTNTTGSTKLSSSANANRPANLTNSTSSSNRLSNADYNRLAAQIVGVPTDKNGNPVCNSYEQYMQFGQTLANLHNGGINKNSTPQEIAAASVGTKNSTPGFNSSQLTNYSKALENLLKGTQQGVSYVNTVPTSTDAPDDKINTISSQYTPEEIEQMEKDKGTMYVWEHVYNKDTNQYDPYKRAAQITGIPLIGDSPVECGIEGKNQFNIVLNGSLCVVEYANGNLFQWEASENAVLNEKIRKTFNQLDEIYEWDYVLNTQTDCSGLTQYIYFKMGINVSHSSSQQSKDLVDNGGYVLENPTLEDLRVGDLITFKGHVGIYAGDGLFLHSTDRENVSLSPLYNIGDNNYNSTTKHGTTPNGIPVTYANGYWGGGETYSTPIVSVTRPKIK